MVGLVIVVLWYLVLDLGIDYFLVDWIGGDCFDGGDFVFGYGVDRYDVGV